ASHWVLRCAAGANPYRRPQRGAARLRWGMGSGRLAPRLRRCAVNRQTVGVVLGTVLFVVLGTVLLYATPGPRAPKVEPPPDAPGQAKITKAKSGKTGKAATPRTVDEAALVHSADIPADRPQASGGAPNVVLVIASTSRRDQWSMYGGPASTTPFLAARA